MRVRIRFLGWGLIVALAIWGCAPAGHFPTVLDTQPKLEAWGPGTVFPSIEAAAVDALIYAYLQARDSHDMQRMRAGTIYSVDAGYSYDKIHTASELLEYRLAYPLNQRDVARFHMYPFAANHDVNRGNERATPTDRRSVAVVDPLHRPLFILHPSLVVREYHGEEHPTVAVVDLRQPKRVILVAGEASTP